MVRRDGSVRPAEGPRGLRGWWPALPLALLALAAVVVVAGVPAAPAPTAQQEVGDTIHDFALALEQDRGEDACAHLTPEGRRTVAARTGTLDCPTTLRTFGIGLDPAALAAAHLTGVTVTGDKAVVARRQLLQPDGTPVGGGIVLVRAGAGWRILGLA